MIEADRYYPKQMNGNVISAYGNAVDEEMSLQSQIEDYLYNLSINTAQETELENIGRIIGFVRPLVPEGFNNENILLFSTQITEDFTTGFGTSDGAHGGEFSSIEPSESNYLDLGLYRRVLPQIALLKRWGITLQSIDRIARIITDDYTIGWNEDNDITLTFNRPVGYKNLWLLTQIFYRIATEPQVIISTEE